jgi:hypothetical protein
VFLSHLQCVILDSPVQTGIGIRKVCRGWTGTNDIPAAGNGDATPFFTLTNDSTITWLWDNQFLLTATTNGGGTIVGDQGWMPDGTNVLLYALTNRHYHFSNWSGDLPSGGDTNIPAQSLLMDQPRNVTAHFPAILAALGTPEWWLALHYGESNDFDALELTDSDADSLNAHDEYIADTDPTNTVSFPRFSHLGVALGGYRLSWPGSTERLYDVYRQTNLTTANEQPMASNIPGDVSGTTEIIDADASEGRQFYRLKVKLP